MSRASQPQISTSRKGARAARAPVAVGVLCAAIYLLTASYTFASGDVIATDVLSWQLGTTGDSTFEAGTYPPLDQHPGRSTWVIKDANGEEVIGRSPGAVVAALPAYFAFGGREFSLVPGAATAALLTAGAVVLLGICLQRFLPSRDSTLATLIFALATPVWSVAADSMWPHTITVLGICGMAWAAATERWWLVGVLGGITLWGRLHAAVIVATLGFFLGWRRHDPFITARIAIGSSGLLVLQIIWNRWLYGSWNPTAASGLARGGEYLYNDSARDWVNHLGFWISPDRGLLVWSPLILLLLPALIRSWSSLPDWSRALIYGGLAYTFIQGLRNPFTGGDGFFGYRLTLELLACSGPALAISAARMGRIARTAFAPVTAFQGFIICAGAVVGRMGSPAEDAWKTHTFLSALAQQPLLLPAFLAICLAAGVLGKRIWTQPRLG